MSAVLQRTRHWTDEDRGGPRTRTIRNYANWARSADGVWCPTDADCSVGRKPDDWGPGAFEFSHGWINREAQIHLRAARPLIGLRRSDRPDCWVNLRPVGARNVIGAPDALGCIWAEAWDGADLRAELRAAGVEDTITIREGAALSYAWSIKMASGMTVKLDAAGQLVYSHDGEEAFIGRAAAAWDAAGAPVGVRTGLSLSGPFPTVTYTLAPPPSAVYPLTLDPTTTLSGTSALDDGQINLANPNYNWGATTTWALRSGGVHVRTLFRANTSGIPAGTITDGRLKCTINLARIGQTMTAHAIATANQWIEGTRSGVTALTGEPCWGFRAYPATTWAGSAGCNTSGTDYDTTPLGTAPIDVSAITLTVGGAIFTAWRSGTRNNNGMILSTSLTTATATFNSTENATTPPSVEIDYSTFNVTRLLTAAARRR